MSEVQEARCLGVVSGLGLGSGIFYYKALVEAHRARGWLPRLLLIHADVQLVMALAAARETVRLAEYLAGRVGQLAGGGAEIATIPAFTPQLCAAELEALSTLPLIGLLDAIVAEVARRELRRVALFGNRVTMVTALFGKLAGVEVVAPAQDEVGRIATIYAGLVENGAASQGDFESLHTLAHRLIAREHLDAIILAGTDLTSVFTPENTDFPHVDGARIHIEAIMVRVAPSLPQ